ncbi:hypothetical protein MferCBS31731_007174 [Microsporum ferrugineum]
MTFEGVRMEKARDEKGSDKLEYGGYGDASAEETGNGDGWLVGRGCLPVHVMSSKIQAGSYPGDI